MFELTAEDDLRTAADDDNLLMWAAQGFATGVRAWTLGRAVAVASPALSGRDRMAVHGPAEDLVALLRRTLPLVGPSYRPLGDADLIAEVCARLDGLEPIGDFGWMHRTADGTPLSEKAAGAEWGTVAGAEQGAEQGAATGVGWLDDAELDEAADLIDRHFPASHAHPHRPGVRAWAGVRDADGRLTALAADAWPAPGIGLLAGVVTDPEHGRGRGHGEAACRLVLGAVLRRSPQVALMVDSWNGPAVRLYRRLGFRYRSLDAAAQCRPGRG